MGKVFRNGNSLAVVIPKAIAHQLNIRLGSRVEWKKEKQGLTLVSENSSKRADEVDPKVAELIEKISKKYTQVWEDLSKL